MYKISLGMIKKPWLIVMMVLISVFIVITILKVRDSGGIVQAEDDSSNPQIEQIKEFWDLYRDATAFRIIGDWEKAIIEYKKALVLNPEHEDAIYYLGNMFLESGAYQEAEKTWFELVRINNNSARAHYQLGHLYMQAGSNALYDLGKAESEFNRTLEINSDFIQPLIHLGQISLYRGDLVQSMEFFTSVLVTDPENRESNLLSGYILWKSGNPSKALDYFARVYNSRVSEKTNLSISNEGDTSEGRSMERLISQSLFQSYLIELSELPGNNPSEVMELLYRKIETYLDY